MMKKLLLLLLIPVCFADSMAVIGVKETASGYEGLFAELSLNITSGSGKVYFDTMPLTEIDTQSSARLARDVACELSGKSCSNLDFFFSIQTSSPVIEGPSAGASMAVLALSSLLGDKLRDDVALTGTINPDGSIGVVGGVVEKAKACENTKVKTVLIPSGTKYLFENETLSIDIIEVSTLDEAYYYFTGIQLSQPSLEFNNSMFNGYMKSMCDKLTDYANSLFNESMQYYESSDFAEKEDIEAIINSTNSYIEKMNNAYLNKSYYSSSSYSISVSINSLYIKHLIDYYTNNSDTDAIINSLNNSISEFKDELDSAILVDNVNDFEAIGISTERMFEAIDLLDDSINYCNENDTYSCLYYLSFTQVRLKTAESWLSLKDLLTGNLSYIYSEDDFQSLAYTRIQNAKTLLSYAQSIYESSYTDYASELLDSSLDAYYNGDYIYSLFESLKSLSNSNLGMSLAGITYDNLNERINISKTLAVKNINSVAGKDFMPILAYSYYEYGLEFIDSDPTEALLFFEYSKQFSLLASQLASQVIETEETQVISSKSIYASMAFGLLTGILTLLIGLEVHYERAYHNKKAK